MLYIYAITQNYDLGVLQHSTWKLKPASTLNIISLELCHHIHRYITGKITLK